MFVAQAQHFLVPRVRFNVKLFFVKITVQNLKNVEYLLHKPEYFLVLQAGFNVKLFFVKIAVKDSKSVESVGYKELTRA